MKPYKIYLFLLILLLSTITNCNMEKDIYTLGNWTVKPGKQTEFIKVWSEFAQWTEKNVSGPGRAYLLQDANDPQKFISFGPWDNEKSIQQWRETDEFKSFVAQVKELCDNFQPNTLKVVASSR